MCGPWALTITHPFWLISVTFKTQGVCHQGPSSFYPWSERASKRDADKGQSHKSLGLPLDTTFTCATFGEIHVKAYVWENKKIDALKDLKGENTMMIKGCLGDDIDECPLLYK